MRSGEEDILQIDYGIKICFPSQDSSQAFANSDYFIHPNNTEDLVIEDNFLYFAGGEDEKFEPIDIEIWGLALY